MSGQVKLDCSSWFATVWILQQFGLATVAAAHWSAWFIAVIIMAFVNALIRPVARFLTAPLNCLTFGIMGVVVNADGIAKMLLSGGCAAGQGQAACHGISLWAQAA